MGIASNEQKEMISYSTAPNYHAGGKPARARRVSSFTVQDHFSDKAWQGQPPVFKDTLQTKTGRDREKAPLRKGVSHFVLRSERQKEKV